MYAQQSNVLTAQSSKTPQKNRVLSRARASDPNHGKAWKCGRGEVASVTVEISPLSTNIPHFIELLWLMQIVQKKVYFFRLSNFLCNFSSISPLLNNDSAIFGNCFEIEGINSSKYFSICLAWSSGALRIL
jgi:hypothetical protein